jgi:anti-sigma factor RsiW
MASAADKSGIDSKQLADLSALADGSLDPSRVSEVRDRIAASPELTALYERERQVVQILHEARAADRAPASLRLALERARPPARVQARRRIAFGGAFAAALAAFALAAVLILPSGTPGAPSVSEAAALAVRGVAAPPPVTDPSAPGTKLDASLGDIYFPDWTQRFGWHAIGQRSDRLNGRRALTVFYSWHGHRIAYTIVDAPALPRPSASANNVTGTEYQTLQLGDRLVVTWRRDDHTCVLSAGPGIPSSVLRRLAAWPTA